MGKTEVKVNSSAYSLSATGCQSLLWSSPVGIGFAKDRVIRDANAALCTLVGYRREELTGKNIRMLFETDAEYDRVGRVKYPALNEHGWVQVETRWVTKPGRVLDIQVSSTWLDPANPDLGIAFMVQDVSERKRAERALLIQSARWYELFEDSPEGIVLLDTDFRYIIGNTEFTRMFGYSDEELRSVPPYQLLFTPDQRQEVDEALATLKAGGVVRIPKTTRRAKDGRDIPVSVLSKPIRIDESSIGMYSIYRDISERIATEEELRRSLRDKEVLLKEVHHRVKNNLNIISSLLSLQKNESASCNLDEPLGLARSRVHSMAMIHDLLYRSTNLGELPFRQYLEDLASYLRSTFGTSTNRVDFVLNLEDVNLDIDTAVPCGLLLNEIIVNSLKHAFPGNRHGTVFLGLSTTREHYVVNVGDDGGGMPDSVDIHTARSMGLELIRGLSSQLNAELVCDRGSGTRYTIRIPRPPR
ncbi:MAG: PAS domain S-box protein [Spirochaetaceae bacterium]|nr:MAG: PAS domain S-box protein [Spirochaetaceae bacterium]